MIAIFQRDANPAVDKPLHRLARKQLAYMLSIGVIQMIGRHQAQYTCDQLNPRKIAKAAKPAFLNCANIESNTQWRIVGQTSPGDFGPGMPAYQLVP